MTEAALLLRLDALRHEILPLPGHGETYSRHAHLFATAQESVTLAKLAEAHWDALAILAEAEHPVVPGAIYAVWASEMPGRRLHISADRVSGSKHFASGIGLADRALITLGGDDRRLIDLDLRQDGIVSDLSSWKVEAFRLSRTGAVLLDSVPMNPKDIVGRPGFYTDRPGFWHGACGPAACWAGGVAGLLPFARASSRRDPHTVAHVAAMEANVWAMRALLDAAGREIDADPHNLPEAHRRALKLRHLIEQLATDTLQRFARAFGPYPLVMNAETSTRYQEVEIFLRQSHAERDLQALGELLL